MVTKIEYQSVINLARETLDEVTKYVKENDGYIGTKRMDDVCTLFDNIAGLAELVGDLLPNA